MSLADRMSGYISKIENNVLRRVIAALSFLLLSVVVLIGCVVEMIAVASAAFFIKATEYTKNTLPATKDFWYGFKELW